MKILIVGAGSIGNRHIRIVQDLFSEIPAGVLTSKTSLANNFSKITIFNTVSEAFAFNPSHIVICTPASTHLGIMESFKELECVFLVEKPLAMNLIETRSFAEINNHLLDRLMVGYNMRFIPSLFFFRNNILKGVVGEVLSVKCYAGLNLKKWREKSDYRKSVSANQSLGGGALLELSHELDYLNWIFGENVWVFANIAKRSSLEIDVEDFVDALIAVRNQNNKEIVINLSLDLVRPKISRFCEVIGELGTLRWNFEADTVTLIKADNYREKVIFEGSKSIDKSYIGEWLEFEQMPNPIASRRGARFMEAYNVLKLVSDIQLSSKLGKKIYSNSDSLQSDNDL